MFTFTLAFFAGHWYFSLHFQLLSTFHGKRKNEFGRKHSEQKPLTTTTTCVRCRVSNWSLCLLYSIPFIFCEGKCISKSWRKLMNYKFPDFSLTLTIPKIFLDFLKISWLFPDHQKFLFFLDFSLTMATLFHYYKLEMSLKSALTLNKVWMTFIHHYHVNFIKLWQQSNIIMLSTILWCRMVHNIIPSHTMYTLLKLKPSPIATICSCMKVAISASTEAFLCQKSKK